MRVSACLCGGWVVLLSAAGASAMATHEAFVATGMAVDLPGWPFHQDRHAVQHLLARFQHAHSPVHVHGLPVSRRSHRAATDNG